MIKKSLLALSIVGLFTTMGLSQRIAIVDINMVLDGMPAYKTAQSSLDKVSAEWRQEIAQEYDKIKSMYNKYQAEQVLLSDDVRKQREDDIVKKEYGFGESIVVGFDKFTETVASYGVQLKKIFTPSTGAYKGVGGFKAIFEIFPSEWSW